ncbi:TAP-like protein-domain-containing protein [Mycena rosella]|uniref:TAP-like protein-domain-containing protein n=1 Tax=Mycena rosella TaxID=1033263 RepID=A0AAD7G3Q4_MYCRO|nr:TAP-like protein-domain-containing protein [Mycena rosella]
MLTRVAAPCILFFAIVFLIFSASPYAKGRRVNIALSNPEPKAVRAAPGDKFSWETITPSEELIWADCYADNQCARLKVPLDYSNPDAASAAIAMIRIHSIVPHNSTNYRGPVLINPGGPGGSGVDMITRRGSQISTIVGPEFDIIGFDPRGIGRSTPRASFFESRSEREIWSSRGNPHTMSMNASADALPRAWARAIIEGQLAGERDDGSLRFINTDHTARDMLRIVQAHGLEKIQYWGFSYGSILGATFASMFPDNIGRFIIDGVADSENYYANEWDNDLIDADKVWSSFIDGCVAAGQEGCPFFSPTATEISEKMDKIYATLRERPIPVRTNTSFGLVDYSMVRRVIFQALYAPYARFPDLAQAFADLSAGNATALFKMSEQPPFECAYDNSGDRLESVLEATFAVTCNDGSRILPGYEDTVTHYQKMSETSTWADVWEPIRIACVAWPEFPQKHFRGPFVANTSFPILLIGNTADPVTPLWSAHKMSQGFNGSVVLTQDSAGHCSISGPSICTQKYVRQYFLEGTLPAPGTVCPVIGTPFPTDDVQISTDAQTVLSLSAADRNLFEAVRDLATTFDIRFPIGL